MLEVESLPLPKVMPRSDVMRSWGHNEGLYDPEFWEFEYRIHRYLSRVANDKLIARYNDIVRNMIALVSEDRHVIPIHSFLSSWYWYRKEHQTRLEFALRKLTIDRERPNLGARCVDTAPARPRGPNACDVLFRYGSRKRLEDFVQCGKVRLTAAREFALLEADPARQDEEREKYSFLPGEYTRITTMDGRELRPIGDAQVAVTGVDYFMLCASCDWDTLLFDDFRVDSCVVIKDPDALAQRLEAAAKAQLSNWYFHHCPIEYFDPYEVRNKQHIDNAMSKNFRLAYQREYRFLWASFEGLSASGFKNLELGPLKDIAELHTRRRDALQPV